MRNKAVKYQVPVTDQCRIKNHASPELAVALAQMTTFNFLRIKVI